MSNTVLYALWGGLYALCAGLGFISEPEGALKIMLLMLSVAVFVPALVLNHRAAKASHRRTLQLIRNLSASWLVLTSLLLIGNFLSVLGSEKLGNLLYSLLTIVGSPLVCSGNWALILFLWAYVFFDSLTKLKK